MNGGNKGLRKLAKAAMILVLLTACFQAEAPVAMPTTLAKAERTV